MSQLNRRQVTANFLHANASKKFSTKELGAELGFPVGAFISDMSTMKDAPIKKLRDSSGIKWQSTGKHTPLPAPKQRTKHPVEPSLNISVSADRAVDILASLVSENESLRTALCDMRTTINKLLGEEK